MVTSQKRFFLIETGCTRSNYTFQPYMRQKKKHFQNKEVDQYMFILPELPKSIFTLAAIRQVCVHRFLGKSLLLNHKSRFQMDHERYNSCKLCNFHMQHVHTKPVEKWHFQYKPNLINHSFKDSFVNCLWIPYLLC